MEIYSHTDPRVERFSSKVSEYTSLARNMSWPFWVFVENSNPIGVVIVGREPLRLFAPVGTTMAIVELIDTKYSKNLERFVSEMLKLVVENGVEYVTTVLLSEKADAIRSFIKFNFKVLADSYIMTHELEESNFQTNLQFIRAKRKEMRKWGKLASRFLAGSPDSILTLGLRHILDLPENFVDLVYNLEEFYFVNKNAQTIGVVQLNSKRGTVGNVGVDSSERGQGHGRQIVRFGLQKLKKAGCDQARLRVHVKNEPAVHLYKSLGFTTKERCKTLIWIQQDSAARGSILGFCEPDP